MPQEQDLYSGDLDLAIRMGELADSRLVPLREHHNSGAVKNIHAVFVGPGRHVPAKVRGLLDFLAERVAQDLV
ncbi:hypothetical protein [Brenneria corticis]|uniref:hypothetical protein n=1 Tax=Brenneria corticis TaxID=2173106 RepID=UPI001AF012A8|nr:hypothetical protein [Brenneria sp. CFCC 11842]